MGSRNILVTGGAGYIGSHMVKDLLGAGYDVLILDNLSRGHRDLVNGGTFIEGDVGDAELLKSLFSERRIDAVMHFAADSLVGESVARPLDYYRNNVARPIELIDAMIRNEVNYLIFSSSAAVYGEPLNAEPICEDHPCNPTNPYGATKLATERLLADCALASNLKYVSLRYFNAAGADASGALGERHEPETHLIPLVLEAAAGKRDHIPVFGVDYPTPDGTCIRDYVHVSDLTHAHMLALESLFDGGDSAVYNLGNSTGHSVRTVIDVASEVTGRHIPAISSKPRPGDPAVLIADSGRIRRDLRWRPRYESLHTIIETAWIWHQRETHANSDSSNSGPGNQVAQAVTDGSRC